MKNSIRSLFLILAVLVSTASACLWDYDTLLEEMSQSPTAIELVTGAFPRHSTDFYQWRIEDRQQKLAGGDERQTHYDDIAVAYDKLHQQEKAIEWMLRKEVKYPGQYETYANLGTFHIHSGNFPEGAKYILKALEINPSAHFDRERYQLYVVQYLQHRVEHGQIVDGKLVLPLSRDPYVDERFQNCDKPESEQHELPERGIISFYAFIADDLADKTVENYKPEYARMSDEETQKAVQGILGMMRFGQYDAPVLLECLANLLVPHNHNGVGNRIAARALLQASYQVEDEEAKAMYKEMAYHSIAGQEGVKIEQLEAAFQRELAQAVKYTDELIQLEKQWIESGMDVEEEFRKKYYKQGKNGTELAYFPVVFEQVAPRRKRRENVLPYPIFVTIASIILGCSIAAHLVPRFLPRRKET